MPVSASKSTGSLAKTLPRAKPPVMTSRPQVFTPGPVRLSNAKRAQLGLKPNPSPAPKVYGRMGNTILPKSKMPQVAKTYKGK